MGEILERATPKQYATGFECDKIGFIQRLPQQWEKSQEWLREQYLEKYYEYTNFTAKPRLDYNVFLRPMGKTNADEVLNYIW